MEITIKTLDLINKSIKENPEVDANKVSDGYHTFGELYKHRIHLFIALCSVLGIGEHPYDNIKVIKSKLHNDGTGMEGWFIVQLIEFNRYTRKEIEGTQISYHLPNEYWDKCNHIETLPKANKWDGHSSDDVLERLLKI